VEEFMEFRFETIVKDRHSFKIYGYENFILIDGIDFWILPTGLFTIK
jgi:hypothetical protein